MRSAEQVQVQLRLPLASLPEHCSSTTAHESLRRFAQGYVFGATSRIGNDPSSSPRQTPTSTASIRDAFPAVEPTDFASRVLTSDELHRLHSSSRNKHLGKKSALVFGEGAPKVTLPVQQRIERRPVPKRCRDSVSVDALSAMMEKLLTEPGCSKRVKSNDDNDDLTKTFGDMKMRRKTGDRIAKRKAGTKNVRSSRADVEDVSQDEKRPSEQQSEPLEIDNDDTADELSFLVTRCDLDSEKKQATFMPYIT